MDDHSMTASDAYEMLRDIMSNVDPAHIRAKQDAAWGPAGERSQPLRLRGGAASHALMHHAIADALMGTGNYDLALVAAGHEAAARAFDAIVLAEKAEAERAESGIHMDVGEWREPGWPDPPEENHA